MPHPSSISAQRSLSNVKTRKRPTTYDFTQDSPPTKRIKSTPGLRIGTNFPPEFWDNLSKIWLTPRALREVDRRNNAQPTTTISAVPISIRPTNLARFARRGGPDLRHLRGCPEPNHSIQMSSNRSVASSSRRTQSTKATTVSSKAKRSSAYDKDFEQNLVDHSIYPEGFEHSAERVTPEPNNLDDVITGLSDPRASLSPSRFSAATFKNFKQANSRVISEGKVMTDILPIISGRTDIPNEGNLPFTNLDSITDGTTVDAVPDLYDGSYPKQVDKVVRQDLSKMITPTSHGRAPLAPNFFVEAKAPRGGADVAKRQACLDGAVGARAMQSLQSYGEDEPVYDGNARTFSSTYHAGTGTLQLYAHHVTCATADAERPEYHMTQIDSWGMTGNADTFRRGATAFRNARDMARRHRDTVITAANARASQAKLPITGGNTSQTDEESVLYGPQSQIGGASWKDSHDDLQQYIAETYVEDEELNGEALTTQHHYSSDESEDPEQIPTASGTVDPSMSFVSSFTSLSTDSTRQKRPRQSFSPPTPTSRLFKSRSRPATTLGCIESSVSTGQSELSNSSWVETYGHKGKICFRNPESQEIRTELKDWKESTVKGARCLYWKSPKYGRVFWTKELPK
ncbi:hypothetical protein NQ176_g1360 [Zarea fungicola]|uniref:Uncharacterized protein n=1 Tax=Zarea fungicola TaxID=93591 RepID=A0ACC1NU79_9HYPO|nr:hypothetical protein NQ176_g1360 [Lecanicillium fungicola]